jgi:predicted dehydrogenase
VLIGLVGCGHWGVNIVRDLRLLHCEVNVVARSEASVGRAREAGATEVVTELNGLGEVDGIVVATPIATHAAVLEETLKMGVPVFVEKPLSDDPEAAVRIAASAENRLFVMDKWRYQPAVQAMAAVNREGLLGRVVGVKTVRVQPDNRHDEDAVWVLAPHELAISMEVLGRLPRPRTAVGQWEDDRLVSMYAVLETDEEWHVAEVSERAPQVERRIELHCSEGLAVLRDGWDEHITLYRHDGRTERIATPGDLPLLAELRAFVEHLEGGPPPRSSAVEGAAVVKTVATLRALAAWPM